MSEVGGSVSVSLPVSPTYTDAIWERVELGGRGKSAAVRAQPPSHSKLSGKDGESRDAKTCSVYSRAFSWSYPTTTK